MLFLSDNNQADVVETLNCTSRCPDDLSKANAIVPSKIYDKQDDFDFEIVNPIFRWS